MKDKTFLTFFLVVELFLFAIFTLSLLNFAHNYYSFPLPNHFTVGIYNGTHIIDYTVDCKDGKAVDINPSVSVLDTHFVLQDPRPLSLKWEILNWGSC